MTIIIVLMISLSWQVYLQCKVNWYCCSLRIFWEDSWTSQHRSCRQVQEKKFFHQIIAFFLWFFSPMVLADSLYLSVNNLCALIPLHIFDLVLPRILWEASLHHMCLPFPAILQTCDKDKIWYELWLHNISAAGYLQATHLIVKSLCFIGCIPYKLPLLLRVSS